MISFIGIFIRARCPVVLVAAACHVVDREWLDIAWHSVWGRRPNWGQRLPTLRGLLARDAAQVEAVACAYLEQAVDHQREIDLWAAIGVAAGSHLSLAEVWVIARELRDETPVIEMCRARQQSSPIDRPRRRIMRGAAVLALVLVGLMAAPVAASEWTAAMVRSHRSATVDDLARLLASHAVDQIDRTANDVSSLNGQECEVLARLEVGTLRPDARSEAIAAAWTVLATDRWPDLRPKLAAYISWGVAFGAPPACVCGRSALAAVMAICEKRRAHAGPLSRLWAN
ncbi:MAG: hypothetical protein HQL40_03240 [Alphaproteobacteria bacterium]|nr:hypothetical protein [Alphaproteobacteria bacterium]MBF0372157.1 hypothetical protein [Alphaproteobacteria bacterium]